MSNIFLDTEKAFTSNNNDQINVVSDKITKLCMSNVYPVYNKFKLFKIALKYDEDLAMEILSRWRDSIVFCDDEVPDNLSILIKTIRHPELKSHERIYTNVHLYNQGYFGECFKCFSDLAFDYSVNIKHRLEAAKYLFTADDEYRDLALECLKDVINDNSYTSKFRYESIASYISRTGISSIMNFKKIKIAYDENFVYALQTVFFNNMENDLQYRILSAQHMLQMQYVILDDHTKQDIISKLFEIAENETNSENIRADATDVVLRLGDSKSKKKARDLIISLGYGGDGRKNKIKTVYNNSQNVHNDGIYKCIEKYIEKITETSGNYRLIPFEDTIRSITIFGRNVIDKERYKNCNQVIAKSLDRISVDSATFSKNNMTVSELLCHIWSRIISTEFTKEESEELKIRLFEELYEMSETCSSGHAARIVNVMSSVDENIMISWEEQIKSNLAGRIQTRMKKCTDPDLSSSIALGMMDDADEEDKNIYKNWVEKQISDIDVELEEEFVNEGYISKTDYDIYFKMSKLDWTN